MENSQIVWKIAFISEAPDFGFEKSARGVRAERWQRVNGTRRLSVSPFPLSVAQPGLPAAWLLGLEAYREYF